MFKLPILLILLLLPACCNCSDRLTSEEIANEYILQGKVAPKEVEEKSSSPWFLPEYKKGN